MKESTYKEEALRVSQVTHNLVSTDYRNVNLGFHSWGMGERAFKINTGRVLCYSYFDLTFIEGLEKGCLILFFQ